MDERPKGPQWRHRWEHRLENWLGHIGVGHPPSRFQEMLVVLLAASFGTWLAAFFAGTAWPILNSVGGVEIGLFCTLFFYFGDRYSAKGRWQTGPWFVPHPVSRIALILAGLTVLLASAQELVRQGRHAQ